jgi:hypothetical protein
MRAFRLIVFLLAVVPLITGPLDMLMGLHAPQLIGARLSAVDLRDPLLNSQIRFFGAIWFGVGLLMMMCLSDLRRHSSLLRATLGVVFLAGLGRTASILQFGLPANPEGAAFVVATTSIEIVGMPALLWWLGRLHWTQDENAHKGTASRATA